MGKHAKPRSKVPVAIAAVPVALAGTGVFVAPAPAGAPAAQAVTPPAGHDFTATAKALREDLPLSHTRVTTAAVREYTVQSGNTLFGIAGDECHNTAFWTGLAAANRAKIPNPNLIDVGQVIQLACRYVAGVTAPAMPAAVPAPVQAPVQQTAAGDEEGGNTTQQQPSAPSGGATVAVSYAGGGTLSYASLERLWEAVGGSPAYAADAACIAEHESGGRQYATGPYGERGYWQINPVNGPVLSTYNAWGNAHAAVVMSHDGTNWGPWTTAPDCGL